MSQNNKTTIRPPRRRVKISRVRRDRLVSLTTIKPIKTAPRDVAILVNGSNGWIEALFNSCFNEFMTPDEFAVHHPTHWLPLPQFSQSDFKTTQWD